MSDRPLRVLMVTPEWPTPGMPQRGSFIVRQANYLRAAGVDLQVIGFEGKRSSVRWAGAWLKTRLALRRYRPDLVHAQGGPSAVLALPKVAPLVVTFRGSDVNGVRDSSGRLTSLGRVAMRMSAMAQASADAVIAVSDQLRQGMACRVPVHVIPSGLDLGLFRPIPRDEARERLGLPLDERLVLFAADPARALKRVELAQAAVGLLPEEYRARLLLSWPALHEEMPLYMSACDALVVTSTREGSPNVVKEALACDLPVVSVPVGDVAQRLAGIDGCAVCTDDRPETIAADLAGVLACGRRVAGRQAVAGLDECLLTQRVLEVYRSVIPGRAAAGALSAGEAEAAVRASGSTDA